MPTVGAVLTPAQVAYHVAEYFGDLGPQVVADMTATALAESGGKTGISGPRNKNGTYDHGLFQINDVHGFDTERLLTDLDYQLAAARDVYDRQGITAWSAWNAGTALDRWDEAAAVVTSMYAGGSGGSGDSAQVARPVSPYMQRTAASARDAVAAGGGTMATGGAGAPVTALTGQDIIQLGAYLANLLAGQRQGALNAAGYSDYGALGIGAGMGPNLARDVFSGSRIDADRNYQASRQDAERQYMLDLQRFGLQYAQTAFAQNLAAADLKLRELQTETAMSGPKDWLRYNYITNNKPAPPTPTVANGSPMVSPTVTGTSPFTGVSAPPPATTSLASPQVTAEPAPEDIRSDLPGVQYAGAPQGADFAPVDTRPDVAGAQAAGWTDTTTQGSTLSAGGFQWSPEGTGGIKALAHGGMSAPSVNGMHAAVVGDPQRRNEANPEVAMSRTPMYVVPMNRLDERARRIASMLPRRATGGTVYSQGADLAADPAITGAPFAEAGRGNRDYAFTGRGEDLGPFGRSPLSYTGYLRALPSERAMLEGYVETDPSQGGLGGHFPDELERARRAAFTGLSLGGGATGYAA